MAGHGSRAACENVPHVRTSTSRRSAGQTGKPGAPGGARRGARAGPRQDLRAAHARGPGAADGEPQPAAARRPGLGDGAGRGPLAHYRAARRRHLAQGLDRYAHPRSSPARRAAGARSAPAQCRRRGPGEEPARRIRGRAAPARPCRKRHHCAGARARGALRAAGDYAARARRADRATAGGGTVLRGGARRASAASVGNRALRGDPLGHARQARASRGGWFCFRLGLRRSVGVQPPSARRCTPGCRKRFDPSVRRPGRAPVRPGRQHHRGPGRCAPSRARRRSSPWPRSTRPTR